jgi:ABC-type transport system involved in multi-copper enzyme maturation permease subunit
VARVLAFELVKLGKRSLTWVLLALLLGGVAATLCGFYALGTSGQVTFYDKNGQVTSAAQGLANFILPGALKSTLDVTQQLGSWLLVVLTATALGMEDAYGTLRIMLSTGLSRSGYLLGKLAALLVATVVFVLAALITGVGCALLIGAATDGSIRPLSVEGNLALTGIAMTLRTVAVLGIPVLLTFCATILSRSQVVGTAAGLGYYLLEAVAQRVLDMLGAQGQHLSPLLPGRDIATIMALNRFDRHGAAFAGLPAIPVAVCALLGYSGLFLVVSWFVFRRRDMTASTG